jgi:hypothetical protein
VQVRDDERNRYEGADADHRDRIERDGSTQIDTADHVASYRQREGRALCE